MNLPKTKISDCSIINLDQIVNDYGFLTSLENNIDIPYKVERIYYSYDIPIGETRGGHAHYELEQYIIAPCGSFEVLLDDGINKKSFTLNKPNSALHIKPGLWRELKNFSSGSICMVLASNKYFEHDYIRNYKEFLQLKL